MPSDCMPSDPVREKEGSLHKKAPDCSALQPGSVGILQPQLPIRRAPVSQEQVCLSFPAVLSHWLGANGKNGLSAMDGRSEFQCYDP